MLSTALRNRALVALQVLLAATLVLTVKLSWETTPGLLLSLLAAMFGAWVVLEMGLGKVNVLPEVREDAELKTTGPYALVRHPMYSALLVFCLGLAAAPPAFWRVGLVVLLGIVLHWKARIEEEALHGRFAEYAEYCKRVKRFVPGVW